MLDTQAMADATPRYEQPMDEPEEFDWDEVITCDQCGHCFQVTDAQCKAVIGHMNPYGRWHKREKEVFNAMRHALKCFGICEVEGELVDLTNAPCDHYTEKE